MQKNVYEVEKESLYQSPGHLKNLVKTYKKDKESMGYVVSECYGSYDRE